MTSSVLGVDPFNNKIRISREERRKSLYILGATGTGKSTLLLNLILQDIAQGIGVYNGPRKLDRSIRNWTD